MIQQIVLRRDRRKHLAHPGRGLLFVAGARRRWPRVRSDAFTTCLSVPAWSPSNHLRARCPAQSRPRLSRVGAQNAHCPAAFFCRSQGASQASGSRSEDPAAGRSNEWFEDAARLFVVQHAAQLCQFGGRDHSPGHRFAVKKTHIPRFRFNRMPERVRRNSGCGADRFRVHRQRRRPPSRGPRLQSAGLLHPDSC